MGRPYKITSEQVREGDQILQEEGLEVRRLTWEQLATEVGADVIDETMKNIMQAALDYEKCLVRYFHLNRHIQSQTNKKIAFLSPFQIYHFLFALNTNPIPPPSYPQSGHQPES